MPLLEAEVPSFANTYEQLLYFFIKDWEKQKDDPLLFPAKSI
jgi:hypothetical protein